jgi:hypothetical protein
MENKEEKGLQKVGYDRHTDHNRINYHYLIRLLKPIIQKNL